MPFRRRSSVAELRTLSDPLRETIAIIGAGPYGLSMAAHLRHFSRANVLVFGKPMSFWQHQMPKGMFLRSGWRASYIADPNRALTLEHYQEASGLRIPAPISLDRFVDYGMWFQRQAAPALDTRLVTNLSRRSNQFLLALDDGETVPADRVIIATGIAPFAHIPKEFSHLPASLVSHAAEHTDLGRFAGKTVAIIGGGQSALESAALLLEGGADVHVYIRDSVIHFLGWRKRFMNFKPLFKLLYSWTDVGPAGLSQLVSHPPYFCALPRFLQDPIARRCIRPAGASWLPARLDNARLHLRQSVQSANPAGSRLKLHLGDGSQMVVDHLLLGTGYKIDVAKYRFLASDLLASIRQNNGYPALTRSFESSVPRMHFLGAPAAWSFGPLLRFVAGTEFSCARLASSLANN